MLVLSARQCPRCVLRFGSSSELEQHLRLDHRPAVPQSESEPSMSSAKSDAAPAETDTGTSTESTVAANRRHVDEAIIVAALIVFIAVVSWHVAAFVSVGMVAAVAVHASYRSAGRNGVDPEA